MQDVWADSKCHKLKKHRILLFLQFWHLKRAVYRCDPCIIFQTDRSGCASQTVSLTEFSLRKNWYTDSFDVSAEMEEFGTGTLTACQILHIK